MCIVCHYKHDNQLVTPEARKAEHPDGFYRCMRPWGALAYQCIDCHRIVEDHNHVCDDLPVSRGYRPSVPSGNRKIPLSKEALSQRLSDKTD